MERYICKERSEMGYTWEKANEGDSIIRKQQLTNGGFLSFSSSFLLAFNPIASTVSHLT